MRGEHPHPHKHALFSLKPYNGWAKIVVEDEANGYIALELDDGTIVLDIGHIRPKSGEILATLGRNASILVKRAGISKVQCLFSIDPTTNVIMFHDMSPGQTTQVSGKNETPFERGRPRKVVVRDNLNTIIGMDGRDRNLIQFELHWHIAPDQMTNPLPYEIDPYLVHTIDVANTILHSRPRTRSYTPGTRELKVRYIKIVNRLGAGQFGEVYKAINIDTGVLMAVKLLNRNPTPTPNPKLKREVEILSRISHVRRPQTFWCYTDRLTNASDTLLITSSHRAWKNLTRDKSLWV
jgi:hypothetical protein